MNSQLSGVKPCTLCMIEKLAMDTALYLINVATGKTNQLLNMLHQGTTVLYWQNCQLN